MRRKSHGYSFCGFRRSNFAKTIPPATQANTSQAQNLRLKNEGCFYDTDSFFILLLHSDNVLPMSKMPMGGH